MLRHIYAFIIIIGAGKTTTFGMLTGELPITSGTAIIDGFDVSTNLKNVSFFNQACMHYGIIVLIHIYFNCVDTTKDRLLPSGKWCFYPAHTVLVYALCG